MQMLDGNRPAMHAFMKLCALLVLSSVVASAQLVSVGVKGGVPLNDAFNTAEGNQSAYFNNTKRYVIGGTVQVNLPFRVSLEADGLYRRLGYQFQQISPTVASASTVANAWEFPAMLKYAFIGGPLRPFVDAGASFRHITGVNTTLSTIAGTLTSSTSPEFNKANDIGFVAGAGLEVKLLFIRITPEIRFTRWGSEAFRSPVNSLLSSNTNQADFLVGITF